MPTNLSSVVHVAKIYVKGGIWRYIYLRKLEDGRYVWHEEESASSVNADSAEEALRLARRHWRLDNFTSLACGTRFTLPERDEIGSPALFHQMMASYSSMNGVYLDDELGHQCIVQDASQEALALWRNSRSQLHS